MDKVAPKGMGKLDMVIAFDTTGSMAAYIEDVRQQVADMIPRLFKDNEDLSIISLLLNCTKLLFQ